MTEKLTVSDDMIKRAFGRLGYLDGGSGTGNFNISSACNDVVEVILGETAFNMNYANWEDSEEDTTAERFAAFLFQQYLSEDSDFHDLFSSPGDGLTFVGARNKIKQGQCLLENTSVLSRDYPLIKNILEGKSCDFEKADDSEEQREQCELRLGEAGEKLVKKGQEEMEEVLSKIFDLPDIFLASKGFASSVQEIID